MIALAASRLRVERADSSTSIVRVTKNPNLPEVLRRNHFLLAHTGAAILPKGFGGVGIAEGTDIQESEACNVFFLPESLAYLDDGDVLKISPQGRQLRVLYRRNSSHNAFLLTERCNSFCLMCSQPPRDIDDSYIYDDIVRALPLLSPETGEIAFTGGEPTLLGDRFVELVRLFKNYLPRTSLHVLSNGRNFHNRALADAVGRVEHHDLMFGIPLYSDISDIHDFVVQADGAYDETIRGILNLKAAKISVEIRVVIHKQTYARLPDLAQFITRNLTFVDHVALMGLEMTGFTKGNLKALWIDPWDYRAQLTEAVHILDRYGIRTSIYNHQLCLVPESVQRFAVKSISDWKNEYMAECEACTRMNECGGFFSSAKLRYSNKIAPYCETAHAHS